MDTITHGIVGALIGKASFAPGESNDLDTRSLGRTAILGATLGSIFPDSDIFAEALSHNDLALLQIHRSITHSFVCLPLWAIGIALLTRAWARWRGWRSPSYPALMGICAIGLASHIALDLITSFGTMCWSPLSSARASWDLVFIIDFAFAGIALAPQLLAWAYRSAGPPARADRGFPRAALRSFVVWLIFTVLAESGVWLARAVGFPYAPWFPYALPVMLAALFFFPLWKNWGLRLSRATWCLGGCAALVGYLALCIGAHAVALSYVKQFVSANGLRAEQIGALPWPPSFNHWDGLIRTSHGVYEAPIEIVSGVRPAAPPRFRFYADNAPSEWLEAARQQPKVQIYLWFARFPVFRFAAGQGTKTVMISDLRFFSRSARPSPFTYQVTFDDSGRVLSQGWLHGAR